MTPKPAGKVKLTNNLVAVHPLYWGLLFLTIWQTFMGRLLDGNVLGMALSTGIGLYFTLWLISILKMFKESSK